MYVSLVQFFRARLEISSLEPVINYLEFALLVQPDSRLPVDFDDPAWSCNWLYEIFLTNGTSVVRIY